MTETDWLNRIPRSLRHLVLLLLVALGLFFAALGRMPFYEPDEGRNAEVAREMLTDHHWLTPHFDTLAYLDKPSFYFWLVAGSFKTFGLNEAAGRLPSALAGLGTLLLVWLLARRMFGDSAGLRAGLVFATAPLVIAFARIVIFDMTLTFFMTLAMLCYWRLTASPERPRWIEIAMFAALGLATFTKGPVGFIVPLLAIFTYEALRGRLNELKKLRWISGLLIMLACVLPWFIAVSLRHPDFPRYAFWQESVLRFATGRAQRAGGIFYYLPVYFAGFFPWSFFLLYAGYNRWRAWKELRNESNAAPLFLLTWSGVIFVFFSISRSKLPGYFLPAIPPLSILMGGAWTRRSDDAAPRAPDWLTAGFGTLLAAGLGIILAAELTRHGLLPARWLGKIPPDVKDLLTPTLVTTGIILAALGWLGRDLGARARGRAPMPVMFALVAITVPLIFVRWSPALGRYAEDLSSRRLARTILESPERNWPVYGFYYFRTSLPFYLRRPVAVVTSDGGELTSNYIRARWQEEHRPAGARSVAAVSPPPPPWRLLPHGGLRPPLQHGGLRPLRQHSAAAVLITGSDWRAQVGEMPMLVIARDDQVDALAASAGTIEPLWSGWNFSVWEVPAR